MGNKNNEQLTPLELEIMDVRWERGSASVRKVQQELKRELAYTTLCAYDVEYSVP